MGKTAPILRQKTTQGARGVDYADEQLRVLRLIRAGVVFLTVFSQLFKIARCYNARR